MHAATIVDDTDDTLTTNWMRTRLSLLQEHPPRSPATISDLLFARGVVPTFNYVLPDRCSGLSGLFERRSRIHRKSVVPFLPLKLRSGVARQKNANLSKLSAFIQCVDNSNTVVVCKAKNAVFIMSDKSR